MRGRCGAMTEKKRRRQETLVMAVRKEPFLTDEALAKKLAVSVQTVRLDRTELGIRKRFFFRRFADGVGR